MDVILPDSHLDTRMKRCVLMNCDCTTPRIFRSMGREREVGKTAGNTINTDDGN